MAQLIKWRINGNPDHIDLYYYGGRTGTNSTTAIKVENGIGTDLDFDLTGKINSTGSSQTELNFVIRAKTGGALEQVNVVPSPESYTHYMEIRSNSSVPGGLELRLSPPIKWADGAVTDRINFTVNSTGPGPVEPDAIVNIEFVGTPAQYSVGYVSGIVGAGTIPNTAPQAFNLKGLVTTTGNTNRLLPITIKPVSGYQIDSVVTEPVGEFNAYLGKNAWTWTKSGANYTTDAVNTMASATAYKINVTTSLIPPEPEPTTKVHLKFEGDLSHFTVGYSGGTTGSNLKPVATGVAVEIDLLGKVSPTQEYLNFTITPINGATLLSCDTNPNPPFGSIPGGRALQFRKGSLPSMSASVTMATASETLYTMTVVSEGPTPGIVSPFNRLFSLTREKMVELSDKMLGVWGTDSTSTSPASSGFLINLMVLPFTIPNEVLGNAQSIKIGSYGTGVQAPIIVDDSIDVNLGNIVVGGLSDSVLDYAAAQYELVLPFFGKVLELDPSQVVGKTINARYVLDAYTGDATVNVFNDASGIPIASTVDRVARAIPFKMFSEVDNKLGDAVQTNNDILQAFIRVTRKEVVTGGVYDNLVQVNGVIGSSPGYMEVQNVELRGVPDSDRVKSLLQSGVVIK
ncbi:hypothetical protein [Pseudomonas sp.]|uniref:hypothetical protein n=1 Tax=Pseudomonas sp. TaxID=306 RepID=UPI003FD6C53A